MSSASGTARFAPARLIVHRGHVERVAVRRRIGVLAAVSRAAVVLHLEREAGVRRAAGIGRRAEDELPVAMSLAATVWPAGHAGAVELQAANAGRGRDDDGGQIIGRGVARIAEAEVARLQRVDAVFVHRLGEVRAAGGAIHRARLIVSVAVLLVLRSADVAAAILHREGEAGVGVDIGVGRELEQAVVHVERRDDRAHGNSATRIGERAVAGRLVIVTEKRLLGSFRLLLGGRASFGSLKLKSAAEKV